MPLEIGPSRFLPTQRLGCATSHRYILTLADTVIFDIVCARRESGSWSYWAESHAFIVNAPNHRKQQRFPPPDQ